MSRQLLLVLLLLILPAPARSAQWPVFGNDPARSGSVYGDKTITASNVARLRLHWRATLGEVADSTPIYLTLRFDGRDRGMLFQTAKDGTTYGIDARNGKIVWRFATHGPNITTSTPAADPSGFWIYAPGVDGFVHKIEARSGAEIRGKGFPARITLMPQTEKHASAINGANGYLYAVTSGYFGDAPPYDGHLVTVRLRDGTTSVFNTLCSDVRTLPSAASCSQSDSGIWSRGGAVVDPEPAMHGRVYIATGNGDFNARSGGRNYGDSVLSLSADGTALLGYYVPENYAQLDSGDVDLGSSSPALLPRDPRSRTPLMLVQGGKDSILRLLDRQHLPGVGGELQHVDIGSALFSTPAVWTDSTSHTWIFLGLAGGARAYRLETDTHGHSKLVHAWNAAIGETEEGTSPIVSNGIVFIAMDRALYALDARTGRVLWDSGRQSAGGTIGSVHWQSPIVVAGTLYCSDENGNLSAYGLP